MRLSKRERKNALCCDCCKKLFPRSCFTFTSKGKFCLHCIGDPNRLRKMENYKVVPRKNWFRGKFACCNCLTKDYRGNLLELVGELYCKKCFRGKLKNR